MRVFLAGLVVVLVSSPGFGQAGADTAGADRAGAQDARALYLQGRQAQAQTDLLAAVELYRASLRVNPSYSLPLIGLAETFFDLEEYEESLSYVEQARRLDQSNLELLVLQARIHIALDQPAEARALLDRVLSSERNNLEARFALAELDIAQGKKKNASQRYLEALQISPQSAKALLSLAVLSEEEGDRQAAEGYIETALRYHTHDPAVHLAAARFATGMGELSQAEGYLNTAIALAPDGTEARRLLAQVYLGQGEPLKAVEVLREILAQRRRDPLVYYTLGLAYEAAGDTELAIRNLAQVLSLTPEDEIARIALENTALAKLPINDPVRQQQAAYHLKRGGLYEERNLLEKAMLEYRRSLRLDPESKDGRLAYAGVFRLMGFPLKYQNQLQVLRSLGYQDARIVDDLERIASESYDTVSSRWGIDQFALDKRRYSICVYHIAPSQRVVHPSAGEAAAGYFVDILRRYETLDIPEASAVPDVEAAFRAARKQGADYFVVAQFEESERSFTVLLSQYHGSTGKLLASYRVFRTGNDRVQDSLSLAASRFYQQLPLRGRLLSRQFDEGVIDVGTLDGLKDKDKLAIVKKGGVKLKNDEIGLAVQEADVLGSFIVTRLDENVAEGTVSKKSFFDLINPGDELLFLPERTAPAQRTAAEGADSGLLRRLLSLVGLRTGSPAR